MSRFPYVHVAVVLQVLVFFCVVQSQPVYAKSLPFYEGLILRYGVRKVWKSPDFGQGDFRINSNVTIQVFQNDGETVRLDYVASHRIVPPPSSDLTISATNYDRSEARFLTSKDALSIHSELTLKDRTTVKVAGDRAELIMVHATLRQKGVAEYKWIAEFPLGYATWLFIPAEASPGNVVSTFTRSDPLIVNDSLTLGSTEMLSTQFGSLETITCRSTSESLVSQGIWHYNHSYYYSRPTGILLEYKRYGHLPRASGTPGEESLEYSFTLVGIEKAQSRLTIDSMPSEANVNSQIKVSGHMYPGAGARVLDVLAKPDVGTEIRSRVTTSQDGAFNVTITPGSAGGWTLQVSYAGDLIMKTSAVERRFEVIGARQTTTTAFSTVSSTAETKTPALDSSTMAIGAIVAVVAAAGVATLMKARKKTTPQNGA
jgi:hypothetical protein